MVNKIETKQFLSELYQDDEALVYFNVDKKTWKNKPQTYAEAKSKLDKLNNSKKLDIYFIPNSGGTKDKQITQINSVFIDWDTGRDSNGKYFPIDFVKQMKQEFLQKLAQFPFKPTYTIETRNGYHVYWFLLPGATSEQFKHMQKSLINYFDSDPKVCNPARVMRLPGYYAYKSGIYSPFFVSIIEHNETNYSVDTFISYFKIDVSSSGSIRNDSSMNIGQNIEDDSLGAHNNIYINKDNTRYTIMGTYPHSPKETDTITLDTMEEVVDYLSQQNIAEFYDMDHYQQVNSQNGLSVICPFHTDTSPSASIYYHEGYCYFKCHSKNCEFGAGTIVKVVQEKENLTDGETVKRLMRHYNIEFDDSWREIERQKIERNIALLQDLGECRDKYPYLYKWVSKINNDLLTKLEFAKNNIKYRTIKGKGIFYCSLTEFERLRRNNSFTGKHRQNERVDRYCLLGLIEKLSEEDIPSGLFGKMNKFRKQNKYRYMIQCYHIPEYTPELLKHANEIARIGSESGIRLNAISKNSIRDIYGHEVAERVYPQVEDIEMSDSSKDLLESMKLVIQDELNTKCYTRISDIIELLTGSETWKSVHDRRVKSLLPGLMETMHLQEIQTNNEIKEKFNIASKGYPKIIVSVECESNTISFPKENISLNQNDNQVA